MGPIRSNLDINARRKVTIACATLLLLIIGLGACASFKTYKLDSRPLAQPITVDGKSDDWRGNLYYSNDGQFSLGVLNDQNDLYVCLVVMDRYKRAQILRRGLTAWFDPQGGDKKQFGIKFPLGLMPEGPPDKPQERPPAMPSIDEEDDLIKEDIPPEGLTELEFITPGAAKSVRLKVEAAQGLALKASAASGLFIYELKIPLAKTPQTPWAVAAQPGKTIGLGFETSSEDTGRMGRGGPGDMAGGGRTPMGGSWMGGGRGTGDMDGYGPGRELPQELKIWATVRLLAGEIVKGRKKDLRIE